MSAYIYNQFGAGISKGKNLAVVFAWARRAGGVASIEVRALPRGNASVFVTYANRYSARVEFSDYSHACAWARARAALSARVSWWHGAAVSCIDYPAVSQ